MPVSIEGGCHCGAVRYKCQTKPAYTFYCHCIDCQRTSGSPFSMELMVERSATEFSGRTNQYEVTGDSGKPVKRHFCPACGSGVYLECDSDPDYYFVKVGGLDDASRIKPEMHIFTAAKQPWIEINDGLPQFAGMPDG